MSVVKAVTRFAGSMRTVSVSPARAPSAAVTIGQVTAGSSGHWLLPTVERAPPSIALAAPAGGEAPYGLFGHATSVQVTGRPAAYAGGSGSSGWIRKARSLA